MSLPKLAYLGPLGTYSHQSAFEKFGTNVEYIAKSTIKDVFAAVSADIPLAVIPIENSTFGQVVDTYDCLRLPAAGSNVFVRGEVTLSIQHCLVARRGVQSQNIKKILSHEQALGQCSGFLSKNFPGVPIQKTSSTATAAQLLLSDEDPEQGNRAAICSSLCATIFDGLEILYSGIQDGESNFTRFFVLSNSLDAVPPSLPSEPGLRHALVRVAKGPSETTSQSPTSRQLHLTISTLLTTFGMPVVRVDRRPSIGGAPFDDDVYFVELDELGGPPGPEETADRSAGDERWKRTVEKGLERLRVSGLEGSLLGLW